MSILGLAWRNTIRSFSRRWPVGVILASAVAVLEVGNTLFESTTEGLERTYVRSFAADWTISAKSDEGFTIFGNELPLIGEYQVLPVLPDAQKWIEKVQTSGAKALGQVTSGGVLSSDGWSKAAPVFGVDFSSYFTFFPDLVVVAGTPPPPDTRALAMNEAQYEEVTKALGSPPPMGTPFTLTVFNDHSFTIREVILSMVFRYPVRDEVLDRIALVDPDTARALNGYVYGAGPGDTTKAVGTSTGDLDALFEGDGDLTGPSGPGLSEKVVEDKLADSTERKSLNATVEGSWNFVLARTASQTAEQLRSAIGDDPGVQVRGWRDSAGGNALIVWLLQVLFNAGLGFVTIAAALVGINGLALSVAERTQELGTIRALGASRAKVATLVTFEALFLVAGAGLLGVALGAGIVAWVGQIGVPLTNPYLQALFGAKVLYPKVSFFQIVTAGLFSLSLGLLAVGVPVRRAMAIQPVVAMAKG